MNQLSQSSLWSHNPHHAADPNGVTDLELGHMGAYSGHNAAELVSRDERVVRGHDHGQITLRNV